MKLIFVSRVVRNCGNDFPVSAQTFGTLLWCLVMTSAAAMAFEQHYHDYAYIFHFYDRVYKRYSRVSMVESILIFSTHFLRLGKTLSYFAVYELLGAWRYKKKTLYVF